MLLRNSAILAKPNLTSQKLTLINRLQFLSEGFSVFSFSQTHNRNFVKGGGALKCRQFLWFFGKSIPFLTLLERTKLLKFLSHLKELNEGLRQNQWDYLKLGDSHRTGLVLTHFDSAFPEIFYFKHDAGVFNQSSVIIFTGKTDVDRLIASLTTHPSSNLRQHRYYTTASSRFYVL